ncbi:MAG: gliding motility lipoprotein GldD [Bacteroidales bacterium]|nr:gliding motility lipoprotein GldD [Bacteroidales bacterium]
MNIIKYISFLLLFISCDSSFTPKPMEYFRIDLPPKAYNNFDSVGCPFYFQYPAYAQVVLHDNIHPWWFNIQFPTFKATLHLTYYALQKNLYKFTEESRSLAYKHDIKADAIREVLYIDTLNNVYGMVYEIKGNAASPLQFYVTDSVHHFLRGSLYFNVKPNKDSLAPVIDFLHKDVKYLIESLRWKL